ncbi:hypothetical protein IS481_05840 [Caldimonas thermodepolymerans]|uniref:Uncharacterized protein n=1 Tax=Caldimonas thermodepolymerans TaxID=215580 RepID=A0A2S5T4C4_9BURK|nr:hypothetical protein [Caldimonas thermodepolymerans]PPE69844.1 hypothetical protein C1702_10215 [Caldimonas thermodepolymerans]QPC32677.1 hypothetical protein IS481_05840 [Caldimonas thermodepolymerans]RDI03434.1 hypothetical protein DES46_101115 [Caldimonas thermodepolymerans]
MGSSSPPRRTAAPVTRRKTGETTANAAQRRLPRLPHERDESSDSQDQLAPEQLERMQQAGEDLARGLEDTDRGPVMDKVYREQLKRPQRR